MILDCSQGLLEKEKDVYTCITTHFNILEHSSECSIDPERVVRTTRICACVWNR